MMHRWTILASLLLAGCVLAPKETKQERAKAEERGKVYERAVEAKVLPEIPQPATWQDVLHRAFLANGDLEGAYFEWQAVLCGWMRRRLGRTRRYRWVSSTCSRRRA